MPAINDRARLAAQPGTQPDVLRDLASDSSPKVRQGVARNPATPADVLEVLVRDGNWHVRFSVAENPAPHALAIALAAPDPDTRGGAARRSDLDAAAVDLVLADPVHTVRERLAEVARAPKVLAALVGDPHPAVRSSVALNPNLSDADIELLAQDRIAQVRATVAASRRAKAETLTKLASDRSAQVRWSVLTHNPERLDLARTIAEDSDEMNARQARSQLERPRTFTGFLGDIDLIE